jgi:hypothetical protein
MMNDKKIMVSMRGPDSVTITGLSREEVDSILGAVSNTCYIGFKENQLEVVSKFNDLPGPVDDPVMYPFWRKPHPSEISQQTVFDKIIFEETSEHDSPAIYISGLCGYYYTPQNYKIYGEKLISYGFECLRSKRDADAMFWESWYLPALWAAKGDLKNHLRNDKNNINLAIEFIRSRISFGSLSISIQKLAQGIPED